jgi:hypothetical protein
VGRLYYKNFHDSGYYHGLIDTRYRKDERDKGGHSQPVDNMPKGPFNLTSSWSDIGSDRGRGRGRGNGTGPNAFGAMSLGFKIGGMNKKTFKNKKSKKSKKTMKNLKSKKVKK